MCMRLKPLVSRSCSPLYAHATFKESVDKSYSLLFYLSLWCVFLSNLLVIPTSLVLDFHKFTLQWLASQY